MFPPHPRGWTPLRPASQRQHTVSPAPAGMDRILCDTLLPRRCFPRTRGDGPRLRGSAEPETEFPPHPRGWTLEAIRTSARVDVSPAPAGMDPLARDPWRAREGFPRTRGDGPPRGMYFLMIVAFPPHPRGWTLHPDFPHADVPVSPAPAGMDPAPSSRRLQCRCFPRTRGDGPPELLPVEGVRLFPPHPRGWTVQLKRVIGQMDVSPAPAGMDPPTKDDRERHESFPRTRGDGPVRGEA